MTLRHGFRLGDRLVKPMENRISGPWGDSHVEPKAMEVLLCLAAHAGDVVTREEVSEAVWGRAIVMDQALTNCISELRKALGDNRSAPQYIATVPKRGYRLIAPVGPLEAHEQGKPARTAAWLAAGIAVLMGAAIVIDSSMLETGDGHDAAPVATVAVVPFTQLSGDERFSHLRFALPDEISTVLAQASELAVRPFQPDAPSDPTEAGRALEVANLITGHYYVPDDGSLVIAIEAIDVNADSILWRTRWTAPAGDVLSIRHEIASRIRAELLPALDVPSAGAGTEPSNAEAYRLYLRSLAVPHDPALNRRGIEMLQESVAIDPAYAPAWVALSSRYYDYGSYGSGGEAAIQHATDAAARALELDPDLVPAAKFLIGQQAEAGELIAAYSQARNIVARRPRNAAAHFALAYVLRYGGMLGRSQRHCEIAVALDPHYYRWRSCAFAFMSHGKLARAAEFIELDAGSWWSNLVTVQLRIRQGDEAGALAAAQRLPPDSADRRLLEPCLQGERGPALAEAATDVVEHWRRLRDPEPAYWTAATMAWCGRTRAAMELLRHAVHGGYCSYPALDVDPIWEPLTESPDLRQIRQDAMQCHDRFRAAIGSRLAGQSLQE